MLIYGHTFFILYGNSSATFQPSLVIRGDISSNQGPFPVGDESNNHLMHSKFTHMYYCQVISVSLVLSGNLADVLKYILTCIHFHNKYIHIFMG